ESEKEQLTSISVLPTNVAGAKESITKSVPLTLPEGVRSIDETAVTIYVTITEIQEQINYSAKTIGIEGLGSGLRATVMPSYTSVVVSGRKTLINGMTSSKFRLYVDLTGLDAGEHTCPIIVEFEDSKYAELAAVLTDKNATVRIEER
ncbi:MAG: hypothetical protein IJO48_00730, partial [Clostridia bacterium]|nr:hypothetical protein [Clostridia bacterium]